jgi:hypothetical protein
LTAADHALPCFLRINKNAGTSICCVLQLNYPAGALLDAVLQGRRSADGRAKTVEGFDEDVYQFLDELQRRLRTLACVAVNLPYGLHKAVSRPVRYFTMLRDPVSRCISYWHFAYRTRAVGRLWNVLEQHEFDIRRICEAGAAYQFTNDQVRMVSGSSAPEPGMAEFQLACEIIEEKFVFAGAVELFDRSLRELARRFAWPQVPSVKLNSGDMADRSILPVGADKQFRDANEWDIRLHEWLINNYLPRKLAS